MVELPVLTMYMVAWQEIINTDMVNALDMSSKKQPQRKGLSYMRIENRSTVPGHENGCCEKTRKLSDSDKNSLDKEVLFPQDHPGIDHEILNAFHRHGMMEAKNKAVDFLSGNGSMHRIKVRFKPKEVLAYFVESEHVEDGSSKRKRKSGWLVPGLGRGVFYVPEEQFSKFFEIIEDEGRIIA